MNSLLVGPNQKKLQAYSDHSNTQSIIKYDTDS